MSDRVDKDAESYQTSAAPPEIGKRRPTQGESEKKQSVTVS